MQQTQPVQIGDWQSYSSEGGEWITFDGNRIAAAGAARLCVWQNGEKCLTVDALSPAPGRARFAKDKIFWGPGFVNKDTGTFTAVESLVPALRPGGAERISFYEWSPSGDKLLAGFYTGNSVQPVSVRLYERRTGKSAVVWQGAGSAPVTAWFGQQHVVLGTGTPQVFDGKGESVAALETSHANIVSIGATANEKRLMMVDLNRQLFLVDTATWTILDSWPGPWLHGSLSADGQFAIALEAWGKAHVACIKEDRFVPLDKINIDSNAVALALGEQKLATIGGGELRWAGLTVDCGNG